MPRSEPGDDATLGWSVIALALSWTMVFLTAREAQHDSSIPIFPFVFLVILYAGLTVFTMRLGLPPPASATSTSAPGTSRAPSSC